MTTIRAYLAAKLEADGYEGLCTDGCGCETSDLAPCQCDPGGCEPGHKQDCTGLDCAEFAHCGMDYGGWCMKPGVKS